MPDDDPKNVETASTPQALDYAPAEPTAEKPRGLAWGCGAEFLAQIVGPIVLFFLIISGAQCWYGH